MARNGLAQHAPEIGGEREVASFVELRWVEARPASVDPAAAHRSAEHEHDVGMPVVGAAIAVLAGGASELRHGDDHGVFRQGAEVDPEGGNGLREIAKHVRKLSFRCAFVDVMVPSTDVGEGNLHAEVRLDELRSLPEGVAEAAVADSSRPVPVYSVADRRTSASSPLRTSPASAVQHGVDGLVIHGLEGVAQRRGGGIAPGDAKSIYVADRNRRSFAGQNARQ